MEPGCTYHLYTHANGFENLFRSDENYRYFLRRYEHFILPVAETYAYCLMPNHVHFLIRIKTAAELESSFGKFETFRKMEARISKQFANLFSSYTQAFNKMYQRRGSLFIPNFKRKEISHDRYFTTVLHYIHANPVHHGFVATLTDWKWSSYTVLLSRDTGGWLKRNEVMAWFGDESSFVRFHEQPLQTPTSFELG
jgi:putative transposase